KGWLSARDLSELYTGIREWGIPDVEARALWDELHASADTRGWAWAGSCSGREPIEQRLEVLVDKVATQAKHTGRIARGFRQALLVETTAAGVDQATLRNVVAERRARERWPATFDHGWHLATRERPPGGWDLLRSCWRWTLDRLDNSAVLGRWRMLAQSGLRVAPPILALMAILNASHPATAARPLASPAPAGAVAPL